MADLILKTLVCGDVLLDRRFGSVQTRGCITDLLVTVWSSGGEGLRLLVSLLCRSEFFDRFGLAKGRLSRSIEFYLLGLLASSQLCRCSFEFGESRCGLLTVRSEGVEARCSAFKFSLEPTDCISGGAHDCLGFVQALKGSCFGFQFVEFNPEVANGPIGLGRGSGNPVLSIAENL